MAVQNVPPADPRRHPGRGEAAGEAAVAGMGPPDISNRLYPRGPDSSIRRSDPGAAGHAEGHQSLIDHMTTINGNVRTDGDLTVEGTVEGDLDCHGKLYIAESARVIARVSAHSVVVAGEIDGEISCLERFEALPTARVAGSVKTPQLTVQEGARIDGKIVMGLGGATISTLVPVPEEPA